MSTHDKSRDGGLFSKIGPGIITGASDDDPSGIGTYSQVGAQFGLSMLWTMLFSYPLMCAVQIISAKIGRTTGEGIAGNIRRHYSASLLLGIVSLLLIANIINIGADIGAMGAALQMILGGSALLYVVVFAGISIVLQVFVPYHRYVRYLKFLTFSLFAYVATVLVIHVPWGTAIKDTILPSLSFDPAYLTAFIAILGTTISPYLFFWQASQEVEDIAGNNREQALVESPNQAPVQLHRIKLETLLGMGFSNIVAWAIIVTAAVTLHAQGHTDISTAEQAAAALKPLAGKLAFALFAAGIIGTGLLAIPVLSGSAAYSVGEALQWPVGLERNWREARSFYAVIAIATALGALQNFLHINPMKALFWTAVINGVVAVPVLIVMMFISTNGGIMGRFTLSRRLRVSGWITTIVMLLAVIGMFATWGQ